MTTHHVANPSEMSELAFMVERFGEDFHVTDGDKFSLSQHENPTGREVSLEEFQAAAREYRAIADRVPCPFTYASGKRCTGHVVRVEGYKADLEWSRGADGWKFGCGEPRSHYHLFCSEKGNHAGYARHDSEKMKFYYSQLPVALQNVVARTGE
ncbi:MAG TPA: hypothetical protein VNS02_05055 [Rhizobiaceae bacterium]|nr:hypothetical protein [Rhizobiaceae bacterium]